MNVILCLNNQMFEFLLNFVSLLIFWTGAYENEKFGIYPRRVKFLQRNAHNPYQYNTEKKYSFCTIDCVLNLYDNTIDAFLTKLQPEIKILE